MAIDLITRDGAEVKVETGHGFVLVYDEGKGGRNHKVEIQAEGLQHPLKTSVDTQAGDLAARTRAAWESGQRIRYRIETERKPSAPQDKPIADLGNTEKFRRLASLEPAGGAGAPAGPQAKTPADLAAAAQGAQEARKAPPAASSPPRAPAATTPNGAPACAACGLSLAGAAVRIVDGKRQHSPKCPDPEAVAAAGAGDVEPGEPAATGRGSAESAPPADPAEPPAREGNGGRAVRSRPGALVAEARPWEAYNTDNSLNLGSYAVLASESMVHLAHDLLTTRNRETAAAEGRPFAPYSPGQRAALARRLLQAADRAQAAVRDDNRVVRMASSHTRARSAVRTALDLYPVPWGAPPDQLEAWVDDLGRAAAGVIRDAITLVDPDPLPAP